MHFWVFCIFDHFMKTCHRSLYKCSVGLSTDSVTMQNRDGFHKGTTHLTNFYQVMLYENTENIIWYKKNPSINYSEWKSLQFPVQFCLLNSLKTTLSSVTFHFIYFISFGSLLIWEWFAHYRCGVTCLRLYMLIQPMNSYNFFQLRQARN